MSSAEAAGLVAQDLDGDEDVDLADFNSFQGCVSGPNTAHEGSATCVLADTDQDGDVDQADFGILQVCYSGQGVSADPTCGGCALPRRDLQVTLSYEAVPSGAASDLIIHGSQIGAVYQLRDDADDRSIGSPLAGNGGTILLSTGPLTQATTFNVLAVNALWGCSTELSTTGTVEVQPYEDRNKIGVHVVIGARNGYGPFIQNCANAGKPVALVKCVDDYGAADFDARSFVAPKSLRFVRLLIDDPGIDDYARVPEFEVWSASDPTANFIAVPTHGRAPLEVQFTDLSLGSIDSWSWDFGDGGLSGAPHPMHLYETPGIYTVSLTVQGPNGSDLVTKLDYVVVETIPADFDRDGDVDQEDFGHFQTCLGGSVMPQDDPECENARLDGDQDVDHLDFAIFMACLSGANVPVDPNCTD